MIFKKIFTKVKRQNNKRILTKPLPTGFHGDKYLCGFVSYCLSNVNQFIETGTNVGSTLIYVLNKFPNIHAYSCEPDKEASDFVFKKISGFKNARIFNQMSPNMLYDIIAKDKEILNKDTVFWLDAHGYGYKWPLIDEIKFITNNFKKGYIFIDDFKVPGLECFNYSKYDNQICSFDYIKNSINPNLKFNLYYPNYTKKTSQHHPLTGWGLIEFGHDSELNMPKEFKNIIKKIT